MQAVLAHQGAIPRDVAPGVRRSCARPRALGGAGSSGSKGAIERRCQINIVFARRVGRRKLVNLDQLLERCNTWGLHLDGISPGSGQRSGGRLAHIVAYCSAISLGELGLLRAAPLLAQADVLISVHGADVLNALAMRAESSVVEIMPVHKANCPCTMYQDMFVRERRIKYYALEPKNNMTRAVSGGHVGKTYHSDLAVDWSSLEGMLKRVLSRLRV